MLGRGGQINFKCHKSYMVKLRGPSSYDTTILHTFLPLLERFLRCGPFLPPHPPVFNVIPNAGGERVMMWADRHFLGRI